MQGTIEPPPPATKVGLNDIKAGTVFYNTEDTNKIVPLRVVHTTELSVTYRMGGDSMRTVRKGEFISLADYMGFKKIAE